MNNIYKEIFEDIRIYRINGKYIFDDSVAVVAEILNINKDCLLREVKKYNGYFNIAFERSVFPRITFEKQSDLDLFIEDYLYPTYMIKKFK